MTLYKKFATGLVVSTGLFLAGCNRQKQETAAELPAAEKTPPSQPAASSGELGATVEGGSPYFSKVVSRLDVGGKSLQFQDHDGRRETLVKILEFLVTSVPDIRTAVPADVDPGSIVDLLGLSDCVASGSSLTKDGNAWLRRSYDHLPAGPKGFRAILGTEAFAFQAPAVVPAATDLVLEARLDATSLPALITEIGKTTAHSEEISQALKQPLPTGGTLEDLLGKTRLQILLGVDVSSWPDKPTGFQPVDFFLRIGGGADLLAMLRPNLEKDMGQPVSIGDRKGWEFPMPGSESKAVLAFDENGNVHLASRAEYLKFVDSAEMKLGGWKEYQAATDHFPAEGNVLAYVSPQGRSVLNWMISLAALSAGDPGVVTAADAVQQVPWGALSFCLAHEKDGVSIMSELPFPADASLVSALPLLSGTSILFIGARSWKKGSDRAACIMNTRNVQQAVRSYQTMNSAREGEAIPWEQIAGPGKMLEARPSCSGGTYTFSDVIPATGKLACTCSNPDHRIPPEDHADW